MAIFKLSVYTKLKVLFVFIKYTKKITTRGISENRIRESNMIRK